MVDNKILFNQIYIQYFLYNMLSMVESIRLTSYLHRGELIMSSILYVIELEIKEDKEQELRNLIKDMVETTSKDSGVLYYHWAIDEGICRTVEHYDSNESTLRHLQMFLAKFAKQYMDMGEVQSCVLYGEPSAEVKEIMDGFATVYTTTVGSYTRK